MDNHATTPVDPRVLEAMLPYFTEDFGNAASRNHAFGWTAEEAVEQRARAGRRADRRRAPRRSSSPRGATESRQPRASRASPSSTRSKGNHIITAMTEHKAVLDTCKRLEKRGLQGHLPRRRARTAWSTPTTLDAAITDKTILVSIMLANNEIGTVQPHRRDRQDHAASRACSSTPTRCRASARCRSTSTTMNIDLASHHRAQDVRPQGRRRALRAAQQAARAPRRRRSTAAATSAACARAR